MLGTTNKLLRNGLLNECCRSSREHDEGKEEEAEEKREEAEEEERSTGASQLD